MTMDRWKRMMRGHKHLVLLVALVVMCLVQPLAQGIMIGLILFDVVLILVLLGVIAVIVKRLRERQLAVAFAVPAMLVQWVSYGLPFHVQRAAAIAHHSLVMLFLALAVAIILRGVFEEEIIQSDHVIATICGYLLAGVAFGNA